MIKRIADLRLRHLAIALSLALSLGRAGASEAIEAPKLRLPGVAAPANYTVDLTIDPARDDFAGKVDIAISVKQATPLLWLNATDLKIKKARAVFNGRPVSVHVHASGADFLGLAFGRPVGPGTLDLHLEFTGLMSRTETQGLFRQRVGADWYAFSQFENTDARRAFPCFDEPSYKTPFRLTLHIPHDTSAVSNTEIASESEGPGEGKTVRFKETPPLPSYLVALAVGPFDFVDAGRAGLKGTPIRIVTPRGKAKEARYAAQVLGPIFEAIEGYLGIPYPYEKLDHLAIPETLGFGAMENAGLVTWASRLLLAPPAEETPRFFRTLASNGAHEIAHQWFGDLVTLAWWDDVWLNESFATWMETKALSRWKPDWRPELDHLQETARIMARDSLPSAPQLRPEILTKADIEGAFDDVTYLKGAQVLSMFEALVGEDRFRDVVRSYLESRKGGSATARDFIGTLESLSGPETAAALWTFLDRPGVPLLDVSLDCEQDEVRLLQKRFQQPGPSASPGGWHLPVCGRVAGREGGRRCVLLSEPESHLPLGGRCPAWLVANDGQRGYYRVRYERGLLERILAVADTDLEASERLGLLYDAGALAEAGDGSVEDALAMAKRFRGDPSRQVVEGAVHVVLAVRPHVPKELLPDYARFVESTFGERARALSFRTEDPDDDETRLLRASLVPFAAEVGKDPALQKDARQLALAWLEDRGAIDADLVESVLVVAARRGDQDLFRRFEDAAKKAFSPRDRERLLVALGSFEDEARVRSAVALLASDAFEPQDSGFLLKGLMSAPNPAPFWEEVKTRYVVVVRRLPREFKGSLPTFFRGFCDDEHRQDVAEFLEPRMKGVEGGVESLEQTLDAIDLCIASKAAQDTGLRHFLAGYGDRPPAVASTP